MSYSKPSIVHIDDAILGSIGKWIPQSTTINRLVRFLSSYSGSDKAFMLIQYTLKLLVPFLELRARLQHKGGKRPAATSQAATSFSKLAGIISDSRMLWRLFGLLPIIQWISSLERSPPSNKRLLNIERLQALSMLVYYPLEHLYYFGAHSVYPMSPKRLTSVSLWSSRAWAAYVVLHFFHLAEDVAVLEERAKRLRRIKSGKELVSDEAEKVDVAMEYNSIKQRRASVVTDFVANLAYFPQTLHWSLEKGFFSNDIWMTLFGFTAAVSSFKNSWDASK